MKFLKRKYRLRIIEDTSTKLVRFYLQYSYSTEFWGKPKWTDLEIIPQELIEQRDKGEDVGHGPFLKIIYFNTLEEAEKFGETIKTSEDFYKFNLSRFLNLNYLHGRGPLRVPIVKQLV